MAANWDDLRVFLDVAKAESLTGAGKSLRLDPATVGRRIARLEDALGLTLFSKSPQGYALTDEGQKLMDHAAQVEQGLAGAVDDVKGEAGQLTGQIRIGAPDGCATFVLPQVTSQIVYQNPGLEVQIVALPRVFNLSKREADMAVAVSMPTTGRLTTQKIVDYKLHLAASRRLLKVIGPIQSRADLKGKRVIGYIPDMIHDRELDYLRELGLADASLASNSVSVQLNWLRQASGIGVVHDFALPFAPGLRKVLPDEVSLTRSFYLIRHADDTRLERLNRFAALLTKGIKAEVERLEAET